MKIIKCIVAASLLASSAMAIEPLKKEAGWSGVVLLGAGGMSFRNNEIAGNRIVDVEDKQINSYAKANSQSAAIPVFTGNIQYTLEDKKTEFFIGNSLEDFLRMDATIALGVRHQFEGLGIMGIRLLASSTPTDVWEDPFLKDTDRSDTERSSAGIGLKWESIMGSQFELDLRGRNFDFDKDLNGPSLVVTDGSEGTNVGNGAQTITQAQQKLLERDGSMASAELLYTWKLGKNNLIVPSVKLTSNDRDGDARDFTQSELKIGHFYLDKKWLIATNFFASEMKFDKENPVFDKKQDTTVVGGGLNVTYRQPFGWKDWAINTGIVGSQANSDIEFYDTSFLIATFGMAYIF